MRPTVAPGHGECFGLYWRDGIRFLGTPRSWMRPDIRRSRLVQLPDGKQFLLFLVSRAVPLSAPWLTASRYGPPGKIRYSFSIVDWARLPEVQAAWVRIAEQHGIMASPFKDVEKIWTPTQLALATPWPMSVRYVFSSESTPSRGIFFSKNLG